MCGIRVARERRLGGEEAVAFDAEPELAAKVFQLAQADAAEFRKTVPQIAKAEQNVGLVRICFGDEPRRGAGRIEEFDDGPEIALGLGSLHPGLFAAIGEKLVA